MEKEEMTDYLIGNQEEMYQWAYRLTRNYDDAQDFIAIDIVMCFEIGRNVYRRK